MMFDLREEVKKLQDEDPSLISEWFQVEGQADSLKAATALLVAAAVELVLSWWL